MRISVVVPAKNEENFIVGCLEALHAQTRQADEIVVVDNGSSDKTAEIAAQFGAHVVFCPTPGVAAARQAGLLAATGDWVATTDADSRPSPRWLEALETQMPNCVALYGPMRMFGLPWWQEELTELGYGVFLKGMSLLGRPNLGAANMAFRRVAALEVGGYPEVRVQEDVILGEKLGKQGKIGYVASALVNTSARRVKAKGGWLGFLRQQISNIRGKTTDYFAVDGGKES